MLWSSFSPLCSMRLQSHFNYYCYLKYSYYSYYWANSGRATENSCHSSLQLKILLILKASYPCDIPCLFSSNHLLLLVIVFLPFNHLLSLNIPRNLSSLCLRILQMLDYHQLYLKQFPCYSNGYFYISLYGSCSSYLLNSSLEELHSFWVLKHPNHGSC